ncbi:MAG TPA: AbrB/MazE/SpoVT family DNA-binding domain-containing protein [Vicinamibacterales bacterium]|jgi:AbrB family looped-hinge helix DNA binding protein
MPTSTLTSKGQITLPKSIRDRLKVSTGDSVEFIVDADGDIRVRAGHGDVRALRGLLRRRGRRPVSLARMESAIRKAARR